MEENYTEDQSLTKGLNEKISFVNNAENDGHDEKNCK